MDTPETKTTVILCAGDFPRHPRPLDILANARRVICCDSAAAGLLAWGRRPDWVVGDLDSLPPELRETLQDRIQQDSEQETNDLCKAFRFCLQHGWTDLTILGATGRREDHTLGNISHLGDFSAQVPDIRLVTDTGTFLARRQDCRIPCRPSQAVSLFSLTPELRLTSSGLQYPLLDLPLPCWWNGTLNKTLGDHFSLHFSQPGTVLIFLQHLEP